MAKYAIERWTRMPVETDIASEFRYRDPVLDDRTLVIGISQSGETADTLAATRYALAQGSTVVGVSNVVDSSLARESHAVLYTRAGPEIGVAATKTFTTQLVAMQLLALYLAQERGTLDPGTIGVMVNALRSLPRQVEEALRRNYRGRGPRRLGSKGCATSSSSAGAPPTRWRWRGLSSSRRSHTSGPRPTPPER